MELETSTFLLLVLCALLAGFFDAIAGGGGLLTLPALFIAGLDPLTAIATNKFQASSASTSALWAFARRRLIDWRSGWPMALLAFSGGAAGALSISLLDRALLEAAVPVLLIAVAGYFAFSPTLDDVDRRQRLSLVAFTCLLAPGIGFYDGVFGPGTGSFYMLALTLLLAQPLMQAICTSKLLNAACNLGALSVFMYDGTILWPLALTMAACAIGGAQLGARCALYFGPRLVRPLLIVVCCLMALKLLSQPDHPIGSSVRALWQ